MASPDWSRRFRKRSRFELVPLPGDNLLEDGKNVLLVVLEVLETSRRFDGGPNRPLETIGVELGLVPVELLAESEDRLAIQRMGGLVLEISQYPPELSKMSDIVVHAPPPTK